MREQLAKQVKVKFVFEESGYCQKFYRTIPHHQLICEQEGDGWMMCVDDDTWNEPTSHIDEDKYDIVITEEPTVLEIFCKRVGRDDVWEIKLKEAHTYFENEMTERGRDGLCAELSDRISEIADPETAQWFMSKRLDLLGISVTDPRKV